MSEYEPYNKARAREVHRGYYTPKKGGWIRELCKKYAKVPTEKQDNANEIILGAIEKLDKLG